MTKPKPKVVAPKTVQTTLKSKAVSKKRPKPDSDSENTDGDVHSLEDDSLLSNTPPSAKRQRKPPGPKKSSGQPLQPIDNESYNINASASAVKQESKSKKTEEYQKVALYLGILEAFR